MRYFSSWWRATRRLAGVLFIGAGLFKVVAHAPFADFLRELDVPSPQFFAAGVALLEITGGLAFLFWPREKRRESFARILAALLYIDMMAALLLVGIPGRLGKAHAVGNHQIGDEAWRVPLEIALLLVALGCVFSRSAARKAENENI